MIIVATCAAVVCAALAVAVRAELVRRKSDATSPSARPPTAAPRGLRPGDVLLHLDDELWLAGAIELEEEGAFVSRVLPAPGSRDRYVVQMDRDAKRVALMTPSERFGEGPLPDPLPAGGATLPLLRRGSAMITRSGERLPPTAARARYAHYRAATGSCALIVDFEGAPRLALEGEELGAFDLLPGGDATERKEPRR